MSYTAAVDLAVSIVAFVALVFAAVWILRNRK